ncbi:MAG: TM2 domain-containing protein [Rhodocyclales bacterium]|nr:TM2 domain-containing protein [Rhodocyclales bacterium]
MTLPLTHETATDQTLPTRQADQKHCYSCGLVIHMSAPQCPKCGAAQPTHGMALPSAQETIHIPQPLPPNHVYCRGCGKPIHHQAQSCPECGAPQRVSPQKDFNSAPKERITAALLALMLGGIGVHKFYLGQYGTGIVYVLFCWTFIPTVVGLIEGLIYLFQSDEDFNKKYN